MLTNEPALPELLTRPFLEAWFNVHQNLPRPGSAERRLSVAVIGAGIAGLCVAHELSHRDHVSTVFEAGSRVGGRILTHRFGNDQYGELGAMRIPVVHSAVKHYISHFGLSTRPFISRCDNAPYNIRGMRIKAADVSKLAQQFGLDSAEWAQRFYRETLIQRWARIEPGDLEALRRRELTASFVKYEQASLKAFLSDLMTAEQYAYLTTVEHMIAFENSSFLETMLGFLNYVEGNMFEIDGGLSRLTESFSSSIVAKPACSIRLNSPVEGISIVEDGVEVRYLYDGSVRTERFDFAVCAMPPSALGRVKFEPSLPARTRHSINNSGQIPASKVIGLCSRAFWADEGIAGGASYVDSDTDSIWYPSSPSRVITVHYGRGDAALRFSALPRGRREELARETLRQLYPGTNIEITDIVHAAWDSPLTGNGGFCRLRPGQFAEECRHRPWEPVPSALPRLFFAGESYSLTHGWLQGAIESSVKATADLLRAAGTINTLTRKYADLTNS